MENNIVEELRKTNSFSNRMLARNIEKIANSNTWSENKEGKISDNNEKKAYDLFLKLVTPECKKALMDLNEAINSISTKIEKASGWFISNDGFKCYSNFQNENDPEFRTFDTYCIYRNEEGYYVDEKEPYNDYFKAIRDEEINFLQRYEGELKLLHEALTKKENIMTNEFVLKDEKNLSLACEISKFLGYKNEQKKVNKTK